MNDFMNDSKPLAIPSMRAQCTPEEWKARIDLAACYRLVDLYGMSDMMANHVSSHVPGQPGAFLINAYGMMYEEITASSLLKVDLAGHSDGNEARVAQIFVANLERWLRGEPLQYRAS